MIDPLAVISPRAQLGEGVRVGPFAVIGPDVVLGARTTVGAHAVIEGPTRIGQDNQIFQFASIGDANLDIVALLQFQCFNESRGKTNRKAVAPFGDLHGGLP